STRAVGPGEATGHEVTEFVKEREVVEFVRVYIAVAEDSEQVSGAVKGAGVPDVQPGPPLDRGPLVPAAGRIIEDEARLDLPHEVGAAPQDVEDVERSGTAVSVLSLETRHHLLPCLRVKFVGLHGVFHSAGLGAHRPVRYLRPLILCQGAHVEAP